jgi:hypothetical protein
VFGTGNDFQESRVETVHRKTSTHLGKGMMIKLSDRVRISPERDRLVRNAIWFVASAMALFISGKAPATDYYWSGQSGSSDNIDQGANWYGGVNPSIGSNLHFNNTAGFRLYASSNCQGGGYFDNIITYNWADGQGQNTYAGATKVNAGTLAVSGSINATASISLNGGTLVLSGGSERLDNSAGLTLNGGTLTFSNGLSAARETLSSLTLSNNSTLDFGTGNHNTLIFAMGISGLGTYALAGFGTPAYQVVPVPEPTTIFGAITLAGLVVYRERRQLAVLIRPRAHA